MQETYVFYKLAGPSPTLPWVLLDAGAAIFFDDGVLSLALVKHVGQRPVNLTDNLDLLAKAVEDLDKLYMAPTVEVKCEDDECKLSHPVKRPQLVRRGVWIEYTLFAPPTELLASIVVGRIKDYIYVATYIENSREIVREIITPTMRYFICIPSRRGFMITKSGNDNYNVAVTEIKDYVHKPHKEVVDLMSRQIGLAPVYWAVTPIVKMEGVIA